jgi:16S rRNA G1207 methylase RsmC
MAWIAVVPPSPAPMEQTTRCSAWRPILTGGSLVASLDRWPAGSLAGSEVIVSARWVVGDLQGAVVQDQVVALDLFELREAHQRGSVAVPFHELLAADTVGPAAEVMVAPPTWRGYAFVGLLEWLVCARLGVPAASTAVWRSPVQGGATGVRRILERRGWQLEVEKRERQVWMRGKVLEPGPMPEPPRISDRLGGTALDLAVGWGVFAGKRIDDGTALLFEAAVKYGPVRRVADVGTGTGVLAIALVTGGHADQAVATDVDAVALHLARRNAESSDADVALFLEDDPGRCPEADLTVCNLPTHARRANLEVLVNGLAARASSGPALVVVHASLERRYSSRFERAGTAVRTVRRATHAVLELTRRRPQGPGGDRATWRTAR